VTPSRSPLVGLRALAALTALLVVVSGSAAGAGAGRAAPFTYVALGDSFSSGEGVAPYFRDTLDAAAGTPVANRCHRSTRAYATFVTPRGFDTTLYALASGGGKAGADNRHGSNRNVRSAGPFTWAFWACSGARTSQLLPRSLGGVGQRSGWDGRPQLESARLAAADLVTLTIGGNDAGYAEVLAQCGLFRCNTAAFRQARAAEIDAARPRLERVYRAIAAKAPRARILVLGYPQMFPAGRAEQSCTTLRPFAGEQDMLRQLGVRLNRVIAAAVTDVAEAGADIAFVPVAARFAGHEVCGRRGAWINGLVGSRVGFGLDPGSFHPTLEGQRNGYAAAVDAALG
jgi:hypothetical protein